MQIFHKKSADLSEKEWGQIRGLNQKIIHHSLYDQSFFDGGCLQSTCENAITKAMKTGTTEVLLGCEENSLISYMIFYCIDICARFTYSKYSIFDIAQKGRSSMW